MPIDRPGATGPGVGDSAALPSGKGIIRPARRPRGWTAPGPPPAGANGDPTLHPRPDEDLCYLTGDWRVFQRIDGHRWSLDDLLTAAMATDGPVPARAIDLGCGIGSVLLMVAWAFPNVQVLGVEAQPLSVDLARRSIAYNGCADRAWVEAGDFREDGFARHRDFLKQGVHLITGTPPYFAPGTHTVSTAVQRGPCRHTLRGGVEAYIDAAAAALAPDGRFVCCMAVGQGPAARQYAEQRGFGLVRRWRVVPIAGKAELIEVVEWQRGWRVPCRETTLVVRDGEGQWTSAFQAIRARMGLPPRVMPH